jgi:hypothetical protein
MTLPDTNAVIRAYLVSRPLLTAVVGTNIYCPRLPANATLPAISFFTRGGRDNPYIPDLATISVQFDCWAKDSATEKGAIVARNVYRKLYDELQGLQDASIVIGATTYYIKSAIEEVSGQDLVDDTVPNYFRTLTFFEFIVR